VINVGCGPKPSRLHSMFHSGWQEVRLDVDPGVEPDLVGSISDMRGLVPDASFDAVWSSHNIEHLYAHEVGPALCEFRRILRPDGFALITCPDIQRIAEFVAAGKLDQPLYHSPAGPIAPLDMIFGHSRSIEEGFVYMAHRTGFTAEMLGRRLVEAGFRECRIGRGNHYDLWALALMPEANNLELSASFSEAPERQPWRGPLSAAG
jgi:predicted SAM-dependent methyltransferase